MGRVCILRSEIASCVFMHSLKWVHISVILILDTVTAHTFPLSTPYALQAIKAHYSNQHVLLSTLQSCMHYFLFWLWMYSVFVWNGRRKGGNTNTVIFFLFVSKLFCWKPQRCCRDSPRTIDRFMYVILFFLYKMCLITYIVDHICTLLKNLPLWCWPYVLESGWIQSNRHYL